MIKPAHRFEEIKKTVNEVLPDLVNELCPPPVLARVPDPAIGRFLIRRASILPLARLQWKRGGLQRQRRNRGVRRTDGVQHKA